MIGVAAAESERTAVHEFFELFKTPWEWLVPGKRYDVVVSADGSAEPRDARLMLVYGAAEHVVDRRAGMRARTSKGQINLEWADASFPVYLGVATFSNVACNGVLFAEGRCVDYRASLDGMTLIRIGYDLFGEIGRLLSQGQPKEQAHVPTLELHIAFLRQCLADAGVPYVEIPPRPSEADFICCLTHDVDFFRLRRHAAFRTLAGFVARGTIGTLLDVLRRRRPVTEAIRNWWAALSLPLVLAGLKRDVWDPFGDYAEADRGHSATFFLVPFKGRPGTSKDGSVDPRRAVGYGISDARHEIARLASPRTEFAVHGIDAWRDAEAGLAEMRELTDRTGQWRAGVRMHWLFFSDAAPGHLARAGFAYDSTWGYNDAVGFRAGTLQAFRLAGDSDLLELPLAIMDTAMFYPDRMGLTRGQARRCCQSIVQIARRFGGALVVNWHDRSLSPERLWGAAYAQLLDELESGPVWFATASAAVDWFRWRRSIRFVSDAARCDVTLEAPAIPHELPAARLVVHRPHQSEELVFQGGVCTVALTGAEPRAVLST